MRGRYVIELVVTKGKCRSILLGPSEKPAECPSVLSLRGTFIFACSHLLWKRSPCGY